jgi:hypothetical protein
MPIISHIAANLTIPRKTAVHVIFNSREDNSVVLLLMIMLVILIALVISSCVHCQSQRPARTTLPVINT